LDVEAGEEVRSVTPLYDPDDAPLGSDVDEAADE
jgi:hypothetical protein